MRTTAEGKNPLLPPTPSGVIPLALHGTPGDLPLALAFGRPLALAFGHPLEAARNYIRAMKDR
jgi:hypothetical protein